MPAKLISHGVIENHINYEKEILEPQKKGYSLEVIARLDAYLDSLLDSLLRQVYSEQKAQQLLSCFEKSMKKDYTFFSGIVRLEILKTTKTRESRITNLKLPSDSLYKKIRDFKTNRNKVLHSELGVYALVENLNRTDELFQLDAETKILETIMSGMDCHSELKDILQDNALKIKK